MNIKWETVDEKVIKVLNKATILGLEITKIGLLSYSSDAWNLFLVKKSNKDYNLYIPKEVKYITYDNDEYLREVKVTLKVIGGEGIEDLSGAFINISIDILDLSELSTHNCDTMNYVFMCSNINKIIFGKDWDTSNVLSMYKIFYSINTEFKNSILELDLNNWDVRNIDNTEEIFAYSKLKSLKINKWNLHASANLACAFKGLEVDELDLTGMQLGKLNLTCKGDNIKTNTIRKIKIDKSDYDMPKVKSFLSLFNSDIIIS